MTSFFNLFKAKKNKKRTKHLYLVMAIYKVSVRFELQISKASTNAQQIRCWVSYNGSKFPFPTGLKIEPQYWNFPTKEKPVNIKKSAKLPEKYKDSDGHKGYETLLTEIRIKIEQLFMAECQRLGDFPAHGDFKDKCKKLCNSVDEKDDKKVRIGLISYLDQLIENSRNGKRTKPRGDRYAERTCLAYETCANTIREFAVHEQKKDFEFEEINLDFYYRLMDYCYGTKKIATNYFGLIVQNIKLVMIESMDAGLHNNSSFRGRKFVRPLQDAHNIYLTENQLQKISDCVFKDRILDGIRDLFLIGCWTGLRFSDFTRIESGDINDGLLTIRTQKTKHVVVIPIHPNLQKIIEKYNGFSETSLLKRSLNVFNIRIKEICEEAGLTEMISLTKNRAGMDISSNIELYKAVSAHTARRSFATNMFRMGVPSIVIMGITGHKTETSFLKYIKVGAKEKAEMMREIWNRRQMKAVSE